MEQRIEQGHAPDSKPVAVQNAGGHSYARVKAQVNFLFVYVKPTSLFVCQAGAGNLNNNRPKGNKYHSAKAIMNNIFDIIKMR